MKTIKIHTEYITLGQFLKYIGVIRSGAEAKSFLQTNVTLVNDDKEERRGKKLYPGTTITLQGASYFIE